MRSRDVVAVGRYAQAPKKYNYASVLTCSVARLCVSPCMQATKLYKYVIVVVCVRRNNYSCSCTWYAKTTVATVVLSTVTVD